MISTCVSFMFRFVFEDQIDFIKASVMDGDNVYLLTSFIIAWQFLSDFVVKFYLHLTFFFLQIDDEESIELLEKSMAKSALEKLQVCIP